MEHFTFEKLPEVVSEIYQKIDRIEKMLLVPTVQSDQDNPITITQAAEHVNLAVPTIYSLVSRGVIPVNKKGKRLYFLKSELNDWIKSGRKKTIAESMENPEQNILKLKGRRLR